MLLSLYCFTLFSYWWIKVGSATFIYSVTTLLLFGLVLIHGGIFFNYVDNSFNHILGLTCCWWWKYRTIPLMLALCIYAVNITYKIIKTNRR